MTDKLTELSKEFGRRGGLATKAKHGKKHYSRIGKISRKKMDDITRDLINIEIEEIKNKEGIYQDELVK